VGSDIGLACRSAIAHEAGRLLLLELVDALLIDLGEISFRAAVSDHWIFHDNVSLSMVDGCLDFHFSGCTAIADRADLLLVRSDIGLAGRSAILHEAGRLLLLKLINALAGDFGETGGGTAVGDNGIVHKEFSFVVACFVC